MVNQCLYEILTYLSSNSKMYYFVENTVILNFFRKNILIWKFQKLATGWPEKTQKKICCLKFHNEHDAKNLRQYLVWAFKNDDEQSGFREKVSKDVLQNLILLLKMLLFRTGSLEEAMNSIRRNKVCLKGNIVTQWPNNTSRNMALRNGIIFCLYFCDEFFFKNWFLSPF